LHLPATVRAAALRTSALRTSALRTSALRTSALRTSVLTGSAPGKRVSLAPADLREAVREGREGNLVLFAVDASGSMAARQRMRAVKGADLARAAALLAGVASVVVDCEASAFRLGLAERLAVLLGADLYRLDELDADSLAGVARKGAALCRTVPRPRSRTTA
jgi:Mg-chelatase subunit ChlD